MLSKPRLLLSALSILTMCAPGVQALETSLEAPGGETKVDITAPTREMTPSAKLHAVLDVQNTAFDRELNLGNEAMQMGRADQAQQHFLAAIHELKKTNSKDDRLLKARNLLGKAYLKDGKLLDAAEAFALALQSAKELKLADSLETARSLEGQANVYAKTEQYKKAEQSFREALKVRETVQGAKSLGVAQCLLQLADLFNKQKLYNEAQPVYELAVETVNGVPDASDLTRAYCLDKLGSFFQEQGKMPEAHSFFTSALALKEKYSTLYTAVDPRQRGLVVFRCENGSPNSVRSFTRGVEVECMNVKDMTAVSTLTAEIFSHDWYLLKAQVTIHNQGTTAISALPELPTLTLESPKEKIFNPLDSSAIATELDIRGERLSNRLLHSADFAYLTNTVVGGTSTAAFTPFGPAFFNTVGTWTTFTPDYAARARAAQAAMSALAQSQAMSNDVLITKPAQTTIAPGQSATFIVYYPYNSKFEAATLRFLVGNSVLEFPFTSKSG